MSRVRTRLMLVPVLLSLSCKGAESTGIKSEPMTLTFEPATVSLVGSRTTDGTLRCPVDLTILAHGSSDHLLSLQTISAGFVVAGVANTPAIISPVTWFGVSSLKRTQTAVTHRQPTAAAPFVFTSVLTYLDQFGTSKTATSTVTCTE